MNPLNFIEKLFNSRALERELSIEKSKVAEFSIKVSELELKIDSLSSDNNQLRQKIKELEGIHDNPLEFDKPTGTWVNETSKLRYCANCKTENIISPLKNEPHGWRCPSCDKYFDDPDRPRAKRQRSPANWRTV